MSVYDWQAERVFVDATAGEIHGEPTVVLEAMVDGGFGVLTERTLELAREELAGRARLVSASAGMVALREARLAQMRRSYREMMGSLPEGVA